MRADFKKDDVYPAGRHFHFEVCMLTPAWYSWLKLPKVAQVVTMSVVLSGSTQKWLSCLLFVISSGGKGSKSSLLPRQSSLKARHRHQSTNFALKAQTKLIARKWAKFDAVALIDEYRL